jgi:hypothetical protein
MMRPLARRTYYSQASGETVEKDGVRQGRGSLTYSKIRFLSFSVF